MGVDRTSSPGAKFIWIEKFIVGQWLRGNAKRTGKVVEKMSTISIAGKDRKVIQGTAAFAKGIAVLQMILDCKTAPTLNELVKLSGLARPTIHRILKALIAEQLVAVAEGKTYKLGPRLIPFAAKALAEDDLIRMANPHLRSLNSLLKEEVTLALLLTGKRLVCFSRLPAHQPTPASFAIGQEIALDSMTLGKVVSAYLQPQQSDDDADSGGTVGTESERVRRQGCLSDLRVDTDQFHFAAPFFDPSRQVVGAIGICVPRSRLNPNHGAYIGPLMRTCHELSAILRK